jgi:hypothetical protein
MNPERSVRGRADQRRKVDATRRWVIELQMAVQVCVQPWEKVSYTRTLRYTSRDAREFKEWLAKPSRSTDGLVHRRLLRVWHVLAECCVRGGLAADLGRVDQERLLKSELLDHGGVLQHLQVEMPSLGERDPPGRDAQEWALEVFEMLVRHLRVQPGVEWPSMRNAELVRIQGEYFRKRGPGVPVAVLAGRAIALVIDRALGRAMGRHRSHQLLMELRGREPASSDTDVACFVQRISRSPSVADQTLWLFLDAAHRCQRELLDGPEGRIRHRYRSAIQRFLEKTDEGKRCLKALDR